MKIKIVSDGTVQGTTVVDAATGEKLSGVTSVTWSVDATKGYAEATLTVALVEIEAVVEAQVDHEKAAAGG